MRSDYQAQIKGLKDKFMSKFEEQNHLIDNLKAELATSVNKNQEYSDKMSLAVSQAQSLREDLQQKQTDCNLLESQAQQLQRQIQLYSYQQMSDQKTLETDKIRIDSMKNQEKHWK